MARSLFEATEDRSGERLVQGILVYLMENDVEFRSAFCRWLGWATEWTAVREEVKTKTQRHDLVVHFRDGSSESIELKLWAGLTEAQSKHSRDIAWVIVPEARKRELAAQFAPERTMTWEDLVDNVASQSSFAERVLSGLKEYAWMGNCLPVSWLREEIRTWARGRSLEGCRVDWFLDRCCDVAADLGLIRTTGVVRSRYWGRYLTRQGRDDWLWLGFAFALDSEEKPVFALQASSDELAERLGVTQALPSWFSWGVCAKGVEFAPTENDTYTVPSWRAASEEILRRYAAMK